MVWERVKKEMTITRILLAVIAILLCCLLTFGLPQKSHKSQENKEDDLDKLHIIQDLIDSNSKTPKKEATKHNIDHDGAIKHNTEHNDATKHNMKHDDAARHNIVYDDATKHKMEHHGVITTTSKPRKFHSVTPPIDKSKSGSKHNSLDVGKNKHDTPLAHPKNTSKNGTELDIIIVINNEQKSKSEHDDSTLVDEKDTSSKHIDKIMTNHLLYTKTVRVSKVEEVFEDIVAQNVRRIIKEDRVERVEVKKNKEMEAIGNELGIKDLFVI